jgi:hypothetical protein
VLWPSYRDNKIGPYSGPVLAGAAVLLSWLTKVWVEDRVRLARLLAGHGWRSVSTALAVVVPVVLAWVFLAGEPAPWIGKLGPDYPGAAALASKDVTVPARPVLPPPNAISLPLYRREGCLVDRHVAQPTECTFGDTSHPVLTVALVGDSAAGEWFSALQTIAVRLHWKLVTELHSTCAWTATVMIDPDKPGSSFDSCHAWGVTVLHDLLTTVRPAVVITTDHPAVPTVAHPHGGRPASADIGAGMARYWTQLKHAGISVVAIRESPDVGLNAPECVVRHPSSLRKCDVPTARAIMRDPPTKYAARLAAVPVIDMNRLICGPQICAPVVGNVLVYSDNHHLTSYYALTTAPYLEKQLLDADEILATGTG